MRPEALSVLKRYYQELLDKLSDDVLNNEDSFAVDQYGPADEIVERYSHKLNSLVSVLKNIEHSTQPTARRVRHQYRVTTIVDNGSGLEETINEWLIANPGVGVQSITLKPDVEPPTCLLLYVRRTEVASVREQSQKPKNS